MSELFKSSSESQVKLPKWVNQASKSNYQMAQNIAARPYEAYTGQRYADFNDTQNAWMNGMTKFANSNVGFGALNDAMGTMRGLSNFKADDIASGIDKYMNPYLDKVANNVMSNMDRSRQMQLMNGGAAATTLGAYGGSRQGVADAITNSEYQRNAGQQLDQLYSQGFNTAAGLSAQDIANQIQSQGLNLNAAGQLANMGGMERAFGLQDLGLLQQVGDRQYALDQQNKDWGYQQWQDQWNYPLQQLGILQSSLGQSPYGYTQTNTSTPSYWDMGTQIAGGVQTAMSL